MPPVTDHRSRRSFRNLGLMASASILSLLVANEAQAACTPPPLTNVPANTVVTCSGTTQLPVITLNGDSSSVIIDAGSTVNNGVVQMNGRDQAVQAVGNAANPILLPDFAVVSASGGGNRELLLSRVDAPDIFISLLDESALVNILNGSTLTATPGNIFLGSGPAAGTVSILNVAQGSSIAASGPGNGQALIIGGGGNVQMNFTGGSLTAAADNLLIDLGNGDDRVTMTGMTLAGGSAGPLSLDGGGGDDTLVIDAGSASRSHDLAVAGFENATLQAATGQTLTLAGTADYSNVTIAGGTVRVDMIEALGANNAAVAVNAGATLELNEVGTNILNHGFSGTGTIRQVDGVNGYNGNSSGFSGTFIVDFNRAVLLNADAMGSANIVNNSLLFFTDFTLANDISGAGSVGKSGPGIGRLTGNNSFSGDLGVQSGTLIVNGVNAVGTGRILTTGLAATFQIEAATDQILANDVIAGLTFVKEGAGILDMTGTNTYTGGTIINAGAIRVDDLARLGTGSVTANAGGSLILAYGGAAPLTLANPFLTGAGIFVKQGSGEVSVEAANGYSGGTRIDSGTLRFGATDALGSGAIDIAANGTLALGTAAFSPTVANDISGSGRILIDQVGGAELLGDNSGFTGAIDLNGSSSYLAAANGAALGSGSVNLNGTGTLLQISNAADTVATADLTGNGSVEKYGAGRLTLTGAGSMSGGAINIFGGTLQIAGSGTIGAAPAITLAGGTTLNLDTAQTTMLANGVAGTGQVVKTGSGTVFLTGSNSYSGGTDIQQGAIRVTDTGFLGSGPINVQAGAALDLSIAGQATLNQAISGAGILRKSAGGDLTLLGNGLTGGVDIVGGRVIVNGTAALGGGPVTTAVDTQLVIDNSATEVSTTLISGGGALTKDGAGTLVINNGGNSYSGGTVINAGRLGLNFGDSLGSGPVIVMQGASLAIGDILFANNVSGAGSIVKTSNGVGALTATNTHSGGTFIGGGALVVDAPDALGSGTVDIAGGAMLAIDYNGAGNVALNNQLTGGGQLIKNGSGTVVINTSGNSYSGGTVINAGRVGLNFGDGLGSGGVLVNAGGQLAIGEITLANAISGAGQIVKTASGFGYLTGTNTHSGGIDIQAGTLEVTGNAPLGTGTINIASGATFAYNNPAAATFANSLSGGGTFRKAGGGTLAFANNFAIANMELAAGRTRINMVATTNVNVLSGATLDGTGRIIGNLANNGVVAPGNSIGTLTVQGNYVHNSGSVLEIEFDGSGAIDLLSVTGTASLNGGTLRFVSVGGAEGSGGTFLTAAGGVTGTFGTIETVGAQLPLAVIYQTDSAIMAPSVLTARPSTFNAQSLAAADTALAFVGSIGMADGRHGEGNRIWMEGFGSWGKRSASGSTLAYDHDSHGIAGGANIDLGGAVTAGAALGWASSDIDLASNGGGGDQSAVIGSAFLRYAGPGFTLGGGLLYGKVDQDTLRNVAFNGFSASIDGETDSTLFGTYAGLAVPLGSTGGWAFGAELQGAYIRQTQDAYTEAGSSPLRLSVGKLKTTTVEGQALLRAKTALGDDADLRFDLGARYLGNVGDRDIPVTFAASNAGITLQGDRRDSVQGVAGMTLDYRLSERATISLGYRGEIGQTDRHTARFGVNFAF